MGKAKHNGKVIFLIDEALKRADSGTLSVGRFVRYEMMELGYHPSNPEDVIKYRAVVKGILQQSPFDVEEYIEKIFQHFTEENESSNDADDNT